MYMSTTLMQNTGFVHLSFYIPNLLVVAQFYRPESL